MSTISVSDRKNILLHGNTKHVKMGPKKLLPEIATEAVKSS